MGGQFKPTTAVEQVAPAALAVASPCGRTAASLTGSRADRSALHAVALVSDLGRKMPTAFDELP